MYIDKNSWLRNKSKISIGRISMSVFWIIPGVPENFINLFDL